MKASVEEQLIAINEIRIESTLKRIDAILSKNSKEQSLYLTLTVALFASGIFCLLLAFMSSAFVWSIPSAITTTLLHWPLKQIWNLRQKNIALAIVPMLIAQLSPDKAEKEIQRLIDKIYE